MASLVTLAAALPWKAILLSLLHNASRTLADDTPSDGGCWYPNGEYSRFGWPCADDANHSNCCPEGFVCMNTGVCKQKGVEYYERESCTDRKWSDPSCPRMCLYGPTGAWSPNSTVVKACKNVNRKETYYCCLKVYDLDTDCCEHELEPDTAEYWDFGNMDVHGTALILEGGRISSIPVTSNDDPTASATSITPATPSSMIWALYTVRTKSPTDSTEPSVVTVTINNSTPIPSDDNDNVTLTSSSNSRATEFSTASYTSSDVATTTPAVETEPESKTSTESRRPTIIGVSVGVPIGLVAITLLLYVLRRYLKYRESCTATVYFPPDPIDPFATRIFPKIELDALPNAIHELDGTTAPSELGSSTNAVKDPRRPPSIVSELEGSPVIPPDPTDRASEATTLKENRWSDVSSLAPPALHRSSRARSSVAETLSIVSQQHHGSLQDVFLTPPRPHASHRLSRPASGLLPNVEVPDDEAPSAPKPSTVAVSQKDSNDMQESHEGEQISASETARLGRQVEKAGEVAQAGESAQEMQTTDEGKLSRKNSTEVPTNEFMQAGEIASEVEAARESEDSPWGDMKLHATEDIQGGEKQHEGTAPHEADTQTQGG